MEHVATHPLENLPTSAQMAHFIVHVRAKAATKASYASSLRSVAKAMGVRQTPVLDLLSTALSVQAAHEPLQQARPVSHELGLRALQQDRTGRLWAALWVAWKTASRWDDVIHLTRRSFILVDTEAKQVIVEWGLTKSTRRQHFRPSSFTVIQDDTTFASITQLQAVLSRLKKEQPLTMMTTAQLRTWFRTMPDAKHLTAHSIKRGAIDVLIRHAADGNLDARYIPLLAKHRDVQSEYPTTTLRYVSDKAAMARMLGTQHATRLL
jgi:hypothetical protein